MTHIQKAKLELYEVRDEEGASGVEYRSTLWDLSQPEWYSALLDESGGRKPYVAMSVNPNYDTNGDVGMVEWSINIGPGQVPGVLEVAYYTADSEGGQVLDHVAEFTLDESTPSTGALEIGSYDGSDPEDEPPWAAVKMLFWPSYMTAARPSL
jgi:hypothetical protein